MGCVVDAANRYRRSLSPFNRSFLFLEKPNILWCGPSITPQPLTQLVTDLETELAAAVSCQKRRYTLM